MAREAQHYEDSTGRQIHGLGRRPDKVVAKNGKTITVPGRFYAIKDRNKTFGTDETEAIRKFRLWEQQRIGSGSIHLQQRGGPLAPDLQRLLDNATPDIEQAFSDHQTDGRLTAESFWETVAHLVRKSPNLCADKTGIEQFRYMTELQPPAASIKVEEVEALYLTKKNCGKEEKQWGRNSWRECLKIMRQLDRIKTLRDIKLEMVEHYHDWAHARIGKGIVAKTVDRKFKVIRTMLNYALKRSPDKEQVRRVLDLTALFETPKGSNHKDPQPISVSDYKKLLKACRQTQGVDGDLWYCLLLMSLNFCFGRKDLAEIMPRHIDTTKGTLVYRRTKKDVMRVGVLWNRTTKAIKAYQKKHPHGLPTIFANYDKQKGRYARLHAKSTLGKQFNNIRKQAGLTVTLSQLRDGGQTVAIEGGADAIHTDILMGHKIPGVRDNYLARNPKMVADACEAIERHYFGGTG